MPWLCKQMLVSPRGRGGGLILMWKEEVNVEVISSCIKYFDTKVTYEGKAFYATFIYGNPDKAKKKQTWDYLTALPLIIMLLHLPLVTSMI